MWALALVSCQGPQGKGQGDHHDDPDRTSPHTGAPVHSAPPTHPVDPHTGTSAHTGVSHTATSHTGSSHTGSSLRWPQFAHCGPLVFAGQAGGEGPDGAGSLAITPDGAVMAGSFVGTATFGGTQVTGSGLADGFVARYTDDGALRWVATQVTSYTSSAHAVAFDAARGRTVAAGIYNSDVTLEGGGVQIVLADEVRDAWVAAWDDAGTLEWAAAIGSVTSTEEITDMAVGPDGEIYVVGTADDAELHATGGPTSTRLDAVGLTPGVKNGFLLRLEPDGTPAYFRVLTSPAHTEPHAVGLTVAGEVVVGSTADDTTVVDPGGPSERTFPVVYSGPLIVRFTRDGALIDGFVMEPGTGASHLDAMTTIPAGVAIMGYFSQDTTFGAGFPGAVVVPGGSTTMGWLGLDGSVAGPVVTYFPASAEKLSEDGAGGVVVAGMQIADVTWAAGTPREVFVEVGPTDPEGDRPTDAVLVTYAPDGSVDCWWHLDGSGDGTRSYEAAFDGRGGVWVAGVFAYTFVVNEGTPSAVTLDTVPEGAGTHHEGDAFLARFLLRPP